MSRQNTKLDILKDILFFFITIAVTYGYLFLLLLIASFVANSVLHWKIEDMYLYAAIGTVVVAIWYIVKKVRKYNGGNR